jgi:DNA-binding LytR/AlgR family response regulator
MITAIAIDDEIPALQVVESFCARLDFVRLEKSFNKPTEALKHLRKFPVDLIFLDINMPSLTGIELYKSVTQETMVIFTTAYSEFAVEGFNVSAVDYLLKPFTFERFSVAVDKAYKMRRLQATERNEKKYLFLRVDYSLVKVDPKEILLIEGLDDYLKIHIKDKKTLVVRMTMKSILEKLSPDDFIRVHRSFIVPFARIENVRNKIITIGEHRIPVGMRYEDVFFAQFGGSSQ